MSALIESLPVLLQLAVFLFYLGLVESVHPTSTLFNITITFAAIIPALYIITLVTGAFFPSCPYKSPTASFFVRGLSFILLVILLFLVAILWSLVALCESLWKRTMTLTIPARLLLMMVPRLKMFAWGMEKSIPSEQGLAQGSMGVGGVVFWWMRESWLIEQSTEATLKVAVDLAQSTPAEVVVTMASWRGGFTQWCCDLFVREDNDRLSKSTSLQLDVFCNFMARSTEGMQAVQRGVGEHYMGIGEEFDTPEFYRLALPILRKVWTNSQTNSDSLEPTIPMPVLDMRPSNVAVYLRCQLYEWCSERPRTISDHELLVQELPIALKLGYFPEQYVDAFIDGAALAAMVLVPDDTHPQLKPVRGLVNSNQSERLFQAIHRLSYYPPNQPPNELLSMAVGTAWRAFVAGLQVKASFKRKAKEIVQCTSWKSGEFMESLYRLSSLSRVWWYAEADGSGLSYGASLVLQVHALMYWATVVARLCHMNGLSKMPLPLLTNIEGKLATFAHPDAPKSPFPKFNDGAAVHLDLTLSLRYITLPLSRPPKLAWSRQPSSTLSLEGYPQVLRQLIHDIVTAPPNSKLRNVSLSIVVKGRDIFLPQPISTRFPDLAADVDHLAAQLFQTDDSFVEPMSEELCATFTRWDELPLALRELQRSLGQLEPGEQIEIATQGLASSTHVLEDTIAPSAPQDLEKADVVLDDLLETTSQGDGLTLPTSNSAP